MKSLRVFASHSRDPRVDKRIIVNLHKFYGNHTPLEIESPTLPPGKFNVSNLWAVQLSAPPGLS
jgi:hypothetical protein